MLLHSCQGLYCRNTRYLHVNTLDQLSPNDRLFRQSVYKSASLIYLVRIAMHFLLRCQITKVHLDTLGFNFKICLQYSSHNKGVHNKVLHVTWSVSVSSLVPLLWAWLKTRSTVVAKEPTKLPLLGSGALALQSAGRRMLAAGHTSPQRLTLPATSETRSVLLCPPRGPRSEGPRRASGTEVPAVYNWHFFFVQGYQKKQ